MILERLREQTEQADILRRRTEARIDKQFAPLRREIARRQAQDYARLDDVLGLYPDPSCLKFDWLESRVFYGLERLLRDRIAAHFQAHAGSLVAPERTHVFIMTREHVEDAFGDPDMDYDDIARLIASCAEGFLPAFRIDELTVSASYSYEDTDVYVTLQVPTFP